MTDPSSALVETPSVISIDGPKVRELRMNAGLLLRDIAGRADITVQYLSQIELSQRPRVRPPVYRRLCTALGVDPDGGMLRKVADCGDGR